MKLEDFMEKKAKSRLKFSNVKKQTKVGVATLLNPFA